MRRAIVVPVLGEEKGWGVKRTEGGGCFFHSTSKGGRKRKGRKDATESEGFQGKKRPQTFGETDMVTLIGLKMVAEINAKALRWIGTGTKNGDVSLVIKKQQ